MPIKGDRGSNLNQPQEIGAKDTQRTIDAWPEMDPNRPADSQTTGRESRAGSSIRGKGAAQQQPSHDPHQPVADRKPKGGEIPSDKVEQRDPARGRRPA
jgi:hypothetical protein